MCNMLEFWQALTLRNSIAGTFVTGFIKQAIPESSIIFASYFLPATLVISDMAFRDGLFMIAGDVGLKMHFINFTIYLAHNLQKPFNTTSPIL